MRPNSLADNRDHLSCRSRVERHVHCRRPHLQRLFVCRVHHPDQAQQDDQGKQLPSSRTLAAMLCKKKIPLCNTNGVGSLASTPSQSLLLQVDPTRVTICGRHTFGCVNMRDFLAKLAEASPCAGDAIDGRGPGPAFSWEGSGCDQISHPRIDEPGDGTGARLVRCPWGLLCFRPRARLLRSAPAQRVNFNSTSYDFYKRMHTPECPVEVPDKLAPLEAKVMHKYIQGMLTSNNAVMTETGGRPGAVHQAKPGATPSKWRCRAPNGD